MSNSGTKMVSFTDNDLKDYSAEWYMNLAVKSGPYSSHGFSDPTDDNFFSTDVALGLSLFDMDEWELEERVDTQVDIVMALYAKWCHCHKQYSRGRKN
jgi:hypothetical protein